MVELTKKQNGFDTILLANSMIKYNEFVAALKKPGLAILQSLDSNKCSTLHMAVGISGEAGELLDAIKKWIIYNKPIDRENVVEELGDLEFFMEGIRQDLGISREETIAANQKKLAVRYEKVKYSDESAILRKDKT